MPNKNSICEHEFEYFHMLLKLKDQINDNKRINDHSEMNKELKINLTSSTM